MTVEKRSSEQSQIRLLVCVLSILVVLSGELEESTAAMNDTGTTYKQYYKECQPDVVSVSAHGWHRFLQHWQKTFKYSQQRISVRFGIFRNQLETESIKKLMNEYAIPKKYLPVILGGIDIEQLTEHEQYENIRILFLEFLKNGYASKWLEIDDNNLVPRMIEYFSDTNMTSSPLPLAALEALERKAGFTLTTSLKGFYLTSNGFRLPPYIKPLEEVGYVRDDAYMKGWFAHSRDQFSDDDVTLFNEGVLLNDVDDNQPKPLIVMLGEHDSSLDRSMSFTDIEDNLTHGSFAEFMEIQYQKSVKTLCAEYHMLLHVREGIAH